MSSAAKTPKAVIFDFDGVILESADIKTDAIVEVFADHPEHQDAILRYHLAHLGVNRYEKFTWVFRELLREPLSDDEMTRRADRFSFLVYDKVLAAPFVPGAREAMTTMRGRIPLFVASGTPAEELLRIMRERHIDTFFDEVWGSPTKKAEAIQTVMDRLSISAADIVFIGDGTTDHDAAEEKGTRFIARTTPPLHDHWVKAGVEMAPDLTDLLERLGLP